MKLEQQIRQSEDEHPPVFYPFIYGVIKKKSSYITGIERPNYKDGWPYCNHCKRNMEKGTIKCTICKRAVRHKPIANKKELKRY